MEVRPTPFPWFGNQVLQVSGTHIYSASKVFTLPAICCEILSRTGSLVRPGREVEPTLFLILTGLIWYDRSL